MAETYLTAADGGPWAMRWREALDSGLTEDEMDAPAHALWVAHVRQVDALLPDGCHWSPWLGAVEHPEGVAITEEEMDGLVRLAAELVDGRAQAILDGLE